VYESKYIRHDDGIFNDFSEMTGTDDISYSQFFLQKHFKHIINQYTSTIIRWEPGYLSTINEPEPADYELDFEEIFKKVLESAVNEVKSSIE
jgi:hypothetical protein